MQYAYYAVWRFFPVVYMLAYPFEKCRTHSLRNPAWSTDSCRSALETYLFTAQRDD